MRRPLMALLGLGLAGALTAALLTVPGVQDRLVDHAIRTRMDTSAREALFDDDAMRLLVCGSASPFPAPDRARACLAVFAGGRFYVVDSGPGSWNRMALLRIPAEHIGGVLLTHFHSDHIGDLGEFNLQTWVAGRTEPLPVYGPEGVQRVVAGYEQAYALDTGYRIAHHGSAMLDPEVGRMQARVVDVSPDGAGTHVLDEDGLRIRMYPVTHDPVRPAVGYRFDYKGRSLFITGDTRYDPNIARAAADVDVLAHEAQNQQIVAQIEAVALDLDKPRYAKIMHDIPSYHTSPVEAAQIANAANARLLLLYHLTPPPPNAIAAMAFMRGVAATRDGATELARDGMLIELPLGSDTVRIRQLE